MHDCSASVQLCSIVALTDFLYLHVCAIFVILCANRAILYPVNICKQVDFLMTHLSHVINPKKLVFKKGGKFEFIL